jgi:hypothetical protein
MRMQTRLGNGLEMAAGLLVGLLGLLWAGAAAAVPSEPILFLGIQRHTAIDRLASEQLSEYLSDRGENILRQVALSDGERRCRQSQCLVNLAHDQRSLYVLSGDVTSAGPHNTLRVQLHLFDVRKSGTTDAVYEIENLCQDCDETKLGILLATTSSDLFSRYRQTAPALPPAAAPPAPPASAPPLPRLAEPPRPADPPLPPVASQLPVESYPAPPLTLPQLAPLAPAAVPPPPPQQSVIAPPPATPLPADPPPPSYSAAALPLIPPPAAAPAPAARRPLSSSRKGVAAMFGVLGFGSLVVAAVMTGLDQRLAPDRSYNPSGGACLTAANAGRRCVLSTVGLYAPLYAVGALQVGAMILTLTLPGPQPRTTPPPAPDAYY